MKSAIAIVEQHMIEASKKAAICHKRGFKTKLLQLNVARGWLKAVHAELKRSTVTSKHREGEGG